MGHSLGARWHCWIGLTSLCLIRGAALAATQVISLDGDWRFRTAEFSPATAYELDVSQPEWATIHVPANWYLQGHDYAGDAWYVRDVQVPAVARDELWLVDFAGVDYYSDVWINGVHLGAHEGYFDGFEFDATGAIKTGLNRIAVRVSSPEEESAHWSLHKRQIKGVLSQHDSRPGGAWSAMGQTANSGGIWQTVALHASHRIALTRLMVETTAASVESATLDLAIDYLAREEAGSATVRIRITPANFSGSEQSFEQSVVLKPSGRDRLRMSIELKHPALWWPATLGAQNLYLIHCEVLGRDGSLLDSRDARIGVRTVARDEVAGNWSVNGQRLFLKGTNYIGSPWLSQVDRQKVSIDFGMMMRANVNAVRVHAHVAPQVMYDVADELGLLIWQDFPLQWGYEDSQVFLATAKSQLLAMIEQFGGHPSVLTWSIHNEPPWNAPWMQYKYDDYDAQQNHALDDALYQLAVQRDPHRPVQEISSVADHPWFGWYSETWKAYLKPTNNAVIAEFGAQALPVLSTLETIFPPELLWPKSDADWRKWEFHNFQRHETFDLAKVQKGANVNEFIRNTQEYQRLVTRVAAEAYRRQKYQPVGAIFQFMFCETWPSINWGMVDYLRVPKPAYYDLEIAYQPVLATLTIGDFEPKAGVAVSLPLTTVNDLRVPIHGGTVSVEVSREGVPYEQRWIPLSVDADAVSILGPLEYTFKEPGKYRILLRVVEAGRELGRNSYELSVRQ